MGSVSVSQLSTRKLDVTATGVPVGGKVAVVQGAVDYAGTAAPVPNTQRIASLSPLDLATGSAAVSVDNARSSYVRTVVRDSAGEVVALSNPVWLMRSAPPGGIPTARVA
jgi:hypothetical protein